MPWGGPIHGSWCGARTTPMRCRYCRTDVFHFSCEHGSSVLFDSLGVPWPERRHLDHLPYERLLELASEDRLARFMEERMTTVRVDWRYAQWAQQAWKSLREEAEARQEPKPAPREILRQVPYPGVTAEETGIIREPPESVDANRRFGAGERTLGEAALGDLGKRSLAQVTIHTGVLGEDDPATRSSSSAQSCPQMRSAGVISCAAACGAWLSSTAIRSGCATTSNWSREDHRRRARRLSLAAADAACRMRCSRG